MRQAHQNPVFKRKDSLKPEYIPDNLPGREGNIDAIAQLIEKGVKGYPSNAFICGPAGTGKTASMKHIFNRMEGKTSALPFYVNCFENSSRIGVIHELLLTIFRKVKPTSRMPSRRGVAFDELWKSFKNEMEKNGINGVVCLDEVDQMDEEGKKILYSLSRYTGEKSKLQILTVTNDRFAFKDLDRRIMSSLRPMKEINFEQYSYDEMEEIVKFRTDHAFREGVVPKQVIEFIAEFTTQEGGDVRIAREALFRAGKKLVEEDKEEMEVEDVREVMDNSQFAKKIQILQRLGKRKKKILRMIPKDGIFFPNLTDMYRKAKGDIGKRRLRDVLHELEETGLLDMNRTGVNGDYKVTLEVPRRILFEVS